MSYIFAIEQLRALLGRCKGRPLPEEFPPLHRTPDSFPAVTATDLETIHRTGIWFRELDHSVITHLPVNLYIFGVWCQLVRFGIGKGVPSRTLMRWSRLTAYMYRAATMYYGLAGRWPYRTGIAPYFLAKLRLTQERGRLARNMFHPTSNYESHFDAVHRPKCARRETC